MVFFSLSLHSVCYFVWVCLDRTHNEYEMCLKLNKKKFVKNDVKKKKARNSFICKLEHWLKNTRKLKKKNKNQTIDDLKWIYIRVIRFLLTVPLKRFSSFSRFGECSVGSSCVYYADIMLRLYACMWRSFLLFCSTTPPSISFIFSYSLNIIFFFILLLYLEILRVVKCAAS